MNNCHDLETYYGYPFALSFGFKFTPSTDRFGSALHISVTLTSQAAAPVKKAAAKPAAAKPVAKPAGVKKTKGWLGGEGGAQTDLDKWYGPNRALYLPGGLLDRAEVADYLTGELPGCVSTEMQCLHQ